MANNTGMLANKRHADAARRRSQTLMALSHRAELHFHAGRLIPATSAMSDADDDSFLLRG